MKYLKLLVIIQIMFYSCGILHDKYGRLPLTMTRQEYRGNQLRIDGMFVNRDINDYDIFFLFRDGILRRSFQLDTYAKTTAQMEEYFKQIKGTNCCNNYPPNWGLYKIDGNLINIEMWRSGDTFEKYPTQSSYGEILNDTTIVLHGFIGKSNTHTFNFVPLSIKPDSTNRFIN